MVNTSLNDLAVLSCAIGGDITLVQGAGGNTSCKIDGNLWVKASGLLLAEAQDRNIFLEVNLSLIRSRIAKGCGDDFDGVMLSGKDAGLRPSIETVLHALLPHTVVLHVHSVRAIAISVQENAEAQLASRLKGLRWGLVPYCRPGVPLAEAVFDVMQKGLCDVLVLANHGLVVGASNCVEAQALLDEVERRLEIGSARPQFVPDLDTLRGMVNGSAYALPIYDECHAMAATSGSVRLASSGSLYPDHVVFLGPGVAIHQPSMVLPDVGESEGPTVLIVPERGVVVRQGLSRGAEEMVRALALVIQLIPDGASVRYLSAEDECALLNWDAEKYRQTLSLRGGSECKS